MRPKKVILCVDDNEQELSVLKFTLATNGYRVLAASNGQEAIAVFSTAPQIDLVLADTNMPQMSGIQLPERLKRMRSHVPMLLLGDAQAAGGEIHVADAVMARKNCYFIRTAGARESDERAQTRAAQGRAPRSPGRGPGCGFVRKAEIRESGSGRGLPEFSAARSR